MGSCVSEEGEDHTHKGIQQYAPAEKNQNWTKEYDKQSKQKIIKQKQFLNDDVINKSIEQVNNFKSFTQGIQKKQEVCKKDQQLQDKLELYNNDIFVKLIVTQLQTLAPTYKQLLQIVSYLSKIKLSISNQIIQQQIQQANDIINKGTSQDFNTLTRDLKQNQSLHRIKSRVLYALGNKLCKQKKQFPLLKQVRQLTLDEINQLVAFEHLQLQVQKFTESFYLKFIEMTKSTQKIGLLFTQCFFKNKEILGNRDFFTIQNGFKAAKFARQGCASDNRGIYIFFNYLARTIKQLEAQNISLDQIQQLIGLLIENISKTYPPGQDLIGGDENLKQALKRIQVTWNKELEPLQNNPLIKFPDKVDKRKILEEQIIKRAKIANQQLPYLNEIIRMNCLKKCIGFDCNLKLYAQAKNDKALVRIIEKLLFKNDKKSGQSKPKGLTSQQKDKLQKRYYQDIRQILSNKQKNKKNEKLYDRLKEEQKRYQKNVENRLHDENQLQFTISDLVRGKCTFSKIQDIIETIEKIKQYVEQSKKSNPKKFRILEVQSRFTKSIPISDITLKIALHQRIIAQLQLTLQNNVATYAFAHKIYELQRSKAFSKIKTVFNYYEQYKNQFQDLVIGQIELSKKQTGPHSEAIKEISSGVMAYFEILGNNQKVGLINILNENRYESKVLNEQQKVFVEVVFDRKMMKSNQQRAPLVSKYLKKKYFITSKNKPTIFISLIFSQAIKDIDIPNNISHICGPFKTIQQYINKNFILNMNDQFQLQTVYLPTLQTEIKYNQLKELFKTRKKGQSDIQSQQLLKRVYGNGEEMCEWFMKKGKIFDDRSQHKKAINEYEKAIALANQKGSYQLLIKINFVKAITLIKDKSFKQAEKIILEAEPKYKQAKQYNKVVICAILLAECALYEGENNKFNQFYNIAKQIVKLHKINYGGVQIAESEYRIGQQLLKNNPKDQEALNLHIHCAFEQFGDYMSVKQLIDKMKQSWSKYKDMGIQEPKLKLNETLKQIDLYKCQLDDDSCLYLSKTQYPNLQKINLGYNYNIGPEGCKHLIKAQWPNLKVIQLSENKIGADGCLHLIKANWPKLQRLLLWDNKIGQIGCQHLRSGKWPNLIQLNIWSNEIPQQEKQRIKERLKIAFPKAVFQM